MKIKKTPLLIFLILAGLLYLTNPLSLTTPQRILFSSLFMVVAIWATDALHKSIASLFLILSFTLFGNTPFLDITGFLWSDTSLLIITTTLLSVGIQKTGGVDLVVRKWLQKTNGSLPVLLAMPYLLGILLVFFIPQAFARVIIMGAVFSSLLENDEGFSKARSILLFNVFIAVTVTYMFFSNGDIILNQAAIGFSGSVVQESLDPVTWFRLMSVPTLLMVLCLPCSLYVIFRKELAAYSMNMIRDPETQEVALSSKRQRLALGTMLVVFLLWMSEPTHGLKPWWVVLVAVLVLFLFEILKKEDLQSINLHFLLFLTAAFSIGKVLGQSGISQRIFTVMMPFIPAPESALFLLSLAIVTVLLHMMIGSAVATMSVVIPLVLPIIQNSGYSPMVLTLMVYLLVNMQFLLPIHHATLMIGSAKGYYSDRVMLRFGLWMSVFVFIALFGFYIPWWRWVGLL